MIERAGLTLVGLSLTNLEDDAAVQLALPLDRHAGAALDATIDDVRDRFGAQRSPGRCCSGAIPGWRCPCCRTERDPRRVRAVALPDG